MRAPYPLAFYFPLPIPHFFGSIIDQIAFLRTFCMSVFDDIPGAEKSSIDSSLLGTLSTFLASPESLQSFFDQIEPKILPKLLYHLLALSNAPPDFIRIQFARLLESSDAQITADFTAGLAHAHPFLLLSLLPDLRASVTTLLEESRTAPDAGASMVRFTGEALFSGGTRSLLAVRLQLLSVLFVQANSIPTESDLTLFIEAVSSSNRFVRAEALMGLTRLVSFSGFMEILSPAMTEAVAEATASGLDDKWNQVRYAGGRLCRVIVERKLYKGKEDLLVPRMLLNRHYEAEGIQNYDQETWKMFVYGEAASPEVVNTTGREIARKFLPEIFAYIKSLLPDNGELHEAGHVHNEHDDRASAAAMLLLHEMLVKVVTPEVGFSVQLCRVAMEMVVAGIGSTAWSIRSVTLQVLSAVLRVCSDTYPTVVESFKLDIVEELKTSITDQIPGIRKDAAFVVNEVADFVGGKRLWREFALELINEGIKDDCCRGHQQKEEEPVNRPMFSCCSFGGAGRKAGSVVERADGGVRLLGALGLETEEEADLLRRLRESQPQLAKAIDPILSTASR